MTIPGEMIERLRLATPLRTVVAFAAAIGSGAAARAAEVPAQLVPVHAATLSSEIAARIDGIATRIGDRFRKGDVLVSFDCALPNAQLTHAQAALTEASRNYEINRRAVAQKTTAQLELDIPAAEVLKAKADLTAAETLVSKCSIAAPFAGVTVDQKMHAFEYATPGQPIVAVVDDRALEVELTVPARWLGWLKPGTPFQFKVEESGKSYPGKLVRLGGKVDPASQSLRAIGEVTGEAPELLPGISGHAILMPP
jgi:membrane fusion protein, multidrug efflux system